MNYGIIFKVLGHLLIIIALGMIAPLLISFYNGENDFVPFLVTIILTLVVGYVLSKVKIGKRKIKAKEGLVIVTLGWVLASLFGALPIYLSNSVPTFTDAFFETVSGFTTTGATIIDNIEILPRGILFWRSFTHWVGGMGILVVAVAILPIMGAGGLHVFRAESPGPITDKITPRIKDTAKLLYVTYIIITLAEIILLMLGGMSIYEAAIHTFGTVGTGGFSTRNSSIGAFNSPYIFIVISIFMIMSGANFSLYYDLYKGKWKEVFKNSELRLYLGIIVTAVVLITINMNFAHYHNIWESFMHSLFQTSSIITTTGYTTANFDTWTPFSKGILYLLMFVGGSAGSTGGSIKVVRILVLFKLILREIQKIFHPRAVVAVKIGNKAIPNDVLNSIASFFFLYMILFGLGTLVISLEGLDLISSSSAVAATLGNIGPGFGAVGATNTYSGFSVFSKWLLSFFMLAGRLELFTVIALFSPKFWKLER